MTRSILRFVPEASRWEALPAPDDDVRILDVVVVDEGCRVLIGSTGPIGFALDVDEDLESRLVALARWVRVDPLREAFDEIEAATVGIVVEIESASSASSSSAVPVRRPLPAIVPAGAPSRRISVEPVAGGVRVAITMRWWLALWGMWFSVVRGDGLVLADLPVRRRLAIEMVPNAVPVRPGDLRGVLHRGPTTRRRVAAVLLAAVLGAAALVLVSSRDSGNAVVLDVPAVPTATTPSSAPSTVATAESGGATPTVTSPGPGTPSPDGDRRPATNFVTGDGVIGADLVVNAAPTTLVAGGPLSVEVLLDWSAINLFGGDQGRGDPVQSMLSCQGVLDVFRTTPTIPGPSQPVALLLQSVDDGERFVVDSATRDLSLVGAMAEECPMVDDSFVEPYRIRQRTFYAPFVIDARLPDDLPAGKYELVLELPGVVWSTAAGPTIDVM